MKKTLQTIKSNLGFLGAVMLADIVGGATTTLTSAAIPNSTTGEIEGCYINSASGKLPMGNLRLIDTQNSDTCTGQAYFNEDSRITTKTSLFKIGEETTAFYAKVADNTNSSVVTAYSVLDSTGACTVIGGWFTSMYSLTTVTLPFTLSLQSLLKF